MAGSFGNVPSEIRKVSGGVRDVIWHIHGSAAHPDKSKLVITEEDYESFYLSDTDLINQLRALLRQHRIVFIGFGWRDPEVVRLLKRVGGFTSPTRSLYALIGVHDKPDFEARRAALLEKFNVDVISYTVTS